jgi:hypothetical protein
MAKMRADVTEAGDSRAREDLDPAGGRRCESWSNQFVLRHHLAIHWCSASKLS